VVGKLWRSIFKGGVTFNIQTHHSLLDPSRDI
jgi:hypothetical protein